MEVIKHVHLDRIVTFTLIMAVSKKCLFHFRSSKLGVQFCIRWTIFIAFITVDIGLICTIFMVSFLLLMTRTLSSCERLIYLYALISIKYLFNFLAIWHWYCRLFVFSIMLNWYYNLFELFFVLFFCDLLAKLIAGHKAIFICELYWPPFCDHLPIDNTSILLLNLS